MSRLMLTGVFAAALASSAGAQNALGDGSALDANRQVGSDGKNRPVRNLEAEIRFRNAIVTGNAPGGLSFRGDVGYSAPGEFQGELSTDTLFEFRRDSLYSGLANYGIRGTEALQHQFALTTGSKPPTDLSGSLAILRAGGGSEADLMRKDPFDPSVETTGESLWTLRSTSAFTSGRALQPVLLSVGDIGGGRVISFNASPLRAVWGEQFDLSVPAAPATTPAANAQAPNRNGYADIMERLEAYNARLASPDPEATPQTWHERVRQMLDQMYGTEEGGAPPATPPADALQLLREAPGTISALVPRDTTAEDFYTRQMKTAQEHLIADRYFTAEEWFTRALATRPGDEMAQVGRIQAELGAGLLLSAATNLRTLFREHPELIGAKYGDDLQPTPERRVELAAVLTEHIDTDSVMATESALLLAYMGYQTDRREWLERGLAYMREHKDVESLFPLLVAVWGEASPEK